MLNVQNYFYFVRFYVDLFWNAGKNKVLVLSNKRVEKEAGCEHKKF